MLSPQELYLKYTLDPCYDDSTITTAYGTPYDLPRLLRFLRHLKYPCIENAPHVDVIPKDDQSLGIKNTGNRKLGIPYKFLNLIDAEAFKEIQPTINGGTAYAIRNCCDLSRACDIESSKDYKSWESRMSTEYLEHFAGNSLPDCLLMLGPDLVKESIAKQDQIPGCGNFNCIANPQYGAAGADFSCKTDLTSPTPKCKSCDECNPDEPWTLCCQAKTCVEKFEMCCGAPQTNRLYFSYLQQSENSRLTLPIIVELELLMDIKLSILKHVGILKRKSYGGYANFIDPSGPDFYACNDDLFLNYFQSKNNYNYATDTEKSSSDESYVNDNTSIDRCKTISFIGGDDDSRMGRVKDLLFNGYGVLLMTNVGFPNTRDSTGISYPDRIWYHTFSIIGYDDTRIEYPECVYLIANSWGDWNNGGEPSWGPIPPGSFLVTESHLKGMTKFNHSPSFWGCRTRFCPDNVAAAGATLGLELSSEAIISSPDLVSLLSISGYTPSDSLIFRLLDAINNSNAGSCKDQYIKAQYDGCSSNPPTGACCSGSSSCVPFYCSKYQSAFGLLFGLSTKNGFPRRKFDYVQFCPINNLKQSNNS